MSNLSNYLLFSKSILSNHGGHVSQLPHVVLPGPQNAHWVEALWV